LQQLDESQQKVSASSAEREQTSIKLVG